MSKGKTDIKDIVKKIKEDDRSFTTLSLAGVDIEDERVEELVLALKNNSNVKTLLLEWVNIPKSPSMSGLQIKQLPTILKALENSNSVTSLSLKRVGTIQVSESLSLPLQELFKHNRSISFLNVEYTGTAFSTLKAILDNNETITKIALTVVDEESNSTAKNFYKGVDEKQNKTLNKMLERNCTREYSIKFTLPNEDKAVLPKALMEIVGDYEYPARELSEGAKEWSKKKKPLSAIEASTGRALNNKNLKSQVDRN